MFQFLAPLGKALAGGLGKGVGDLGELLPAFGLDKLFGGGEDPPNFKSFEAPGENIDPRQSLDQALEAALRLGQGMSERKPVQLRSSYVQPGPAPVQVPGLGFQIGGGLGQDPALRDPSLLQGQDRGINQYDPFQSIARSKPSNAEPRQNTRERSPR